MNPIETISFEQYNAKFGNKKKKLSQKDKDAAIKAKSKKLKATFNNEYATQEDVEDAIREFHDSVDAIKRK